MPQDFGGASSEPKKPKPLKDWRTWVTSPPHLAGAVAALSLLGFGLGYLVVAIVFLPSHDVASGLVRVPDLEGMNAEDARATVERARLEFHETAGLSRGEPPGIVLAQEPLPGQLASPGSPVEATVSVGSRQRPVPDVLGLNRSQAEAVLRRAGFSTDFIWVDADNDVGQVVATRPAAGTLVDASATVRLVVSAGPPTPNVPDLTGRSLDEARAALQRLGLRLGEVEESPDSLAAPGTVLDQAPEPGSLVDRGAVVSVVVAVALPPMELADTLRLPLDTAAAPVDTIPGDSSRGER
jgi:serine/threonine-protein kinase